MDRDTGTRHTGTCDTGTRDTAARGAAELPTAPSSVVWSRGRAFVLERAGARVHWTGVDDRGRPCVLSASQLRRRGWSRSWR